MSKRIISIILLALTLLSTLIPCVGAADTGDSPYTSEVARELSGSTINGKAFNFADYPKDRFNTEVSVLFINEVGFRAGSDQSDWVLYLYLYNPSGQAYDFTTGKCAVNMGYEWSDTGAVTAYTKFALELVSASDEEGMENVFLKVRVKDKTIGARTFAKRLSSKSTRIYAFSEVELLIPGKVNATSFSFARRYEVTGYDKGYGTYASQNNKTVKDTGHNVIQCKPVQTYWRSDTSSGGKNHRWQVNAVYFSVPKAYFKEYDNLDAVKCEWFEAKTQPIIATDDVTLYTKLKPWVGWLIGGDYNNGSTGRRWTTDIPYGLWTSSQYSVKMSAGHVNAFTYGYNVRRNAGVLTSPLLEIPPNINPLGWLLRSEAGEIKLNQEFVSKDTMLEYYTNMVKEKGEAAARQLLLTNTVDEGRKYGKQEVIIHFDDTYLLENYDSNHSWFQKFLDYNIFNGGWKYGTGYTTKTGETYENFQPINIIDSYEDIAATPAQLAESLYFATEEEARKFKEYATDALKRDEYVVLLRYAERDYYSEVMEVTPKISGTAVVAVQTVFLDFDIIELDFKKDAETIVVPVTSSPTNGIGGIKAPQVDDTNPGKYLGEAVKDAMNTGKDLVRRIVGIVLIVLGVLVLLKVVQIGVRLFRDNRDW